uniref:Interleukin-1 n=1 Tax=Eptatretus burgeri TaxID=7764 RepID=A0A8C4NDZ3_EPTBU
MASGETFHEVPSAVLVRLDVQRDNEGLHTYTVSDVATINSSLSLRKGDVLLEMNDFSLEFVTPENLLVLHKCAHVKLKVKRADQSSTNYPANPTASLRSLHRVFFNSIPELKHDIQHNGQKHMSTTGQRPVPKAKEIQNSLNGGQTLTLVFLHPQCSILTSRGSGNVERLNVSCSVGGIRVEGMWLDTCASNEACQLKSVLRGLRRFVHSFLWIVEGAGKLEELVFRLFRELPEVHVVSEYDTSLTRCNSPVGVCAEPFHSPIPKKFLMTIYEFKPLFPSNKGVPVILGFTNSNCFLACKEDDTGNIRLTVETCDPSCFKSINNDDKEIHPFMFFRKEQLDGSIWFESACFPHWFIESNAINSCVFMDKDHKDHTDFYLR